MKPYIDLKGASGAVYRYKLAEDHDPRTTIAGNFVYIDDAGTVLMAGEANNLHAFYTTLNRLGPDGPSQCPPPLQGASGEHLHSTSLQAAEFAVLFAEVLSCGQQVAGWLSRPERSGAERGRS